MGRAVQFTPTTRALPALVGPARLRRFRWHLLIPSLFCLITIVMLWPLVAHLRSAVAETDADPLLNAWALHWVQHALITNPTHLYDGNIFAPNRQTLAFSEALIPQALLAWPVYLLTHDSLAAYNLSVLVTFPLCAVGMYALCRALNANRGAAFLAGLLFAFAPFRMDSTAHLQVLSMQWMPLALLAVVRFTQRPSGWRAMAVTATLVLCGLSSVYYAVMFGLGFAVFLLIEVIRQRRAFLSRTGVGLLVALAIAGGIVVALDRPYLQVREEHGINRTLDEAYDDAAHQASYATVVPGSIMWGRLLPTSGPEHSALFPGALLTLLALAGLRFVRRIWMPGLVGMAAVAFVLSFGPTWGEKDSGVPLPYQFLYQHIVGFQGIRGPDRFAAVLLTVLAIFAALGATWLWERATVSRLTLLRFGFAVAAVFAGMGMLDLGAKLPPTIPIDRSTATLAPYRWLANDADAGVVAEFPVDVAMRRTGYYSTYHWRPVLWGHSGFLPEAQYRLAARFADRPDHFPTPPDFNALADMGVRTLVIHRDQYSAADLARLHESLAKIPERTPLLATVGKCDIYGLTPSAVPPAAISAVTIETTPVGNVDTLVGQITVTNTDSAVRMLYTTGKPRIIATFRDTKGNVVETTEVETVVPSVSPPGDSTLPISVTLPHAPGDYTLTITAAHLDRFPMLSAVPVHVLAPGALPHLTLVGLHVSSPPVFLPHEPVAMWVTLNDGRSVPLRDVTAANDHTIDTTLISLPKGTALVVAHGKTSGIELVATLTP